MPEYFEWLRFAMEVATLVALIVYVAKTWQMAAATRSAAEASAAAYQEAVEARTEALAPRVLLYLSPEISLFKVVVENAGAGTAVDVHFLFDPQLQTTHPRMKPVFFNSPQALLPSGYKLTHTVDTWPSYLNSPLPKQYSVTVSYRGMETGKTYSTKYVLDVDAFRNLYVTDRKNVHDVAMALEGLKEALPRPIKDLVDRLTDVGEDVLLAPSSTDVRSAAQIASDMSSTLTILVASDSSQKYFVNKKPLIRRLSQDALSLHRALSREDSASPILESVQTLVFCLLDDRGSHMVADEWKAEIEAALKEVRSAITD